MKRDYTVNNDLTLKDGEEHEFKGRQYKRSYIGGAAFDHEILNWEESEYGSAMWELYRTDRRKYFEKYHNNA